ncbi:hyalin-like [Strongylocentrotus purpuratus]|uniref:Hyalin n=1 Tax=Strongylocentrotus purpuratus TaxID=7668 RepID=A0A7M7P9G2_STRPU|nr:hyalin-like [Strongylocentrotus purpuratus]
MNPCENGWCEETMTRYRCHCPIGFQGKRCHELDTNRPATTQDIVVTCVKDITVTVELGIPNKSVEFTSPSAVNTEVPVVLVSQNYKSGDDFTVGSTLVEYIFADESGNQASRCTFNVNVNTVDTTPPEVQSCPFNQTFSVIKTTTPIAWTPPTASDASGIAFIVANYEPGVNVSVNSPISVIYTVTDNSGLVNTNCSFNITLVSVETQWECTSSKCYHVNQRWPTNWHDAHSFCLTLGPITTNAGDRQPSLLFADTEEASQLALILETGDKFLKSAWINCNDMETNGIFMCDVDGKGAVQINLTDWAKGRPSGYGYEKCVALTGEYKWLDLPCTLYLNTICQIVL